LILLAKGCAQTSEDAPWLVFHFMFPYPDHRPTLAPQLTVPPSIASLVTGDLVVPVITIGLWHSAMLGAAMPEAPVDKHSHSFPVEREVRSAWEIRGLNPPAAQSMSGKKGPQASFRGEIPS
jgi:hypothetical protein